MVAAKPPRVLTHGHPRFPNEEDLIKILQRQLGRQLWIVHRLDRSASGAIVISKSREFVPILKSALEVGVKSYLALVRGYFDHDGQVLIDKPMKVKGKLKQASSMVGCLGRCHEPRSSLLLVRPRTGRYHQVRRHVRDLSHPVLLDAEHGDCKVNRWWRQNMGLQRLGLHAFRIDFELPMGKFVINCPLFQDHANVFRKLPWWENAVEKEPGLLASPLAVS